ncbi:YqiA/YcfP family alpha/beta fold hydrolase [Thiocapsa bogorovii]|uniref:YqiA/YcfP family alpha/beta fold hydrolase n=1 Tax=Thiocapsa bogorovii TaxID=521689 RepID=UPI001E4961F3|nr:YqiA/YcfP family alpha/beta fold hydrolase [Thiocapsa bogorovii]UHD14640.1 alpha/beta fold hydrolase [Thiocapsa bogorovii]
MLVYIHGLNSSSRSFKATRLRERLDPHSVVAIDYPAHRPADAVALLSDFFATLPGQHRGIEPTVVGSSMGGFYGQYLARRFRFSHLYMINPALTPWSLFREYIGEIMTAADGERYQVSEALIESTRPYGITEPCDGTPSTLFLERGDEVIDSRIAERLYAECGRLMVWEGGDHTFQHLDEAIETIRQHLDDLDRTRP